MRIDADVTSPIHFPTAATRSRRSSSRPLRPLSSRVSSLTPRTRLSRPTSSETPPLRPCALFAHLSARHIVMSYLPITCVFRPQRRQGRYLAQRQLRQACLLVCSVHSQSWALAFISLRVRTLLAFPFFFTGTTTSTDTVLVSVTSLLSWPRRMPRLNVNVSLVLRYFRSHDLGVSFLSYFRHCKEAYRVRCLPSKPSCVHR